MGELGGDDGTRVVVAFEGTRGNLVKNLQSILRRQSQDVRVIIDDFDVSVVERKELFLPIYNRLGFLGRGEIRLIVAKEFVDLFRSGSLKKMTVSYAIPLLTSYFGWHQLNA